MDAQALPVGWLVVGFAILAVVVPIASVLMQLVVRWVGKAEIGFARSLAVVVAGGVLCWIGNVAIVVLATRLAPTLATRVTSGPGQLTYFVVALALDLAMYALAVGLLVRREDGMGLPFARVIAIAASYLAGGFALVFAAAGLLAALFALLR